MLLQIINVINVSNVLRNLLGNSVGYILHFMRMGLLPSQLVSEPNEIGGSLMIILNIDVVSFGLS